MQFKINRTKTEIKRNIPSNTLIKEIMNKQNRDFKHYFYSAK
jgi:hypothetical protein